MNARPGHSAIEVPESRVLLASIPIQTNQKGRESGVFVVASKTPDPFDLSDSLGQQAMYHRSLSLAISFAALFSFTCEICAGPLATSVPIEPDPAIRALLIRLTHPISSDDVYVAFTELDQIGAKGRGVEIIQQGLALAAKDEQAIQMGIPSVYIPKLGLWPAVVLKAAVPMLDSADKAQREQSESLLKGFISNPGLWLRDKDVVEYFESECPQPPERFVAFLCSFAPRTALLSLDAAYPDPERHRVVVWADHVVSDVIWKNENDFAKAEDDNAARAQLNLLSRRAEWWVRLYVAEIMRQYAFLRQAEILARLSKDENKLVRERAVSEQDSPTTRGKRRP